MFWYNSFFIAIFPLQHSIFFLCVLFSCVCFYSLKILYNFSLVCSFFLFLFLSTVVAQAYKVDVEVLAASRGCSAILRCVIPTFVKELVRVVSWVQEPAFYIYPSLQGGNKLTFATRIKATKFLFKSISTVSTHTQNKNSDVLHFKMSEKK